MRATSQASSLAAPLALAGRASRGHKGWSPGLAPGPDTPSTSRKGPPRPHSGSAGATAGYRGLPSRRKKEIGRI